MPQDDRNTIEVLKAELNFVTKGGYGRSPRESWRAVLPFEDSPTCMNYDAKGNPSACSECLLSQFVPDEQRHEKVPCRHIPLTPEGESLMNLYRGGTQDEIEEALGNWLKDTIAKLECEASPEPA
jgi:hypothetical protein